MGHHIERRSKVYGSRPDFEIRTTPSGARFSVPPDSTVESDVVGYAFDEVAFVDATLKDGRASTMRLQWGYHGDYQLVTPYADTEYAIERPKDSTYVDLKDGDCGGSMFGQVIFKSSMSSLVPGMQPSILPEEDEGVLVVNIAKATEKRNIGSISPPPIPVAGTASVGAQMAGAAAGGLSFPIDVDAGHGKYVPDPLEESKGQCFIQHGTRLTITHVTRGSSEVHADGAFGLFPAEVETAMELTIQSTTALSKD